MSMSPRAALVRAALAACLLTGAASRAAAQDVSAAAACPPGNLLAGRLPVQWITINGNRALVTDGNVAPEGAIWNAPVGVILDTPAATLTYRLDQLTKLEAVYLQGDANDTYEVWGSADGQQWRSLGRVEAVEGHGLRGRTLRTGGVPVRFLRIGEGIGDNFYSISELQAFCQVPTPFPPKLNVVQAPPAVVGKGPWWNNETSARWELALGVLGLLFLLWCAKLKRDGATKKQRKLRDFGFAALGLLAFLSYFNFGKFHFDNFVHGWDTFHYYVGSKYFKELSYDRLYECVAVADAEDPLLKRRVELRKITNLRTNVLETTHEILRHPERCKQHFSPQRWESFKRDLAYFRTLESPKRWDEAQTDHGYNGTPVWNIAGTILANTGPATRAQIILLDSLDIVYLIAACGMIAWAFGWRVLSIALVAFATNFPNRYYWTGGSFLRWDWLFYLVAGVCLLKKERPKLAGAALAYATLLRIFPMFAFVGPVLAAGIILVRERRLDRRYLNLFVGAAIAVAVLIPVSFKVSGGIETYKAFIANTIKHKETPLTNYMGLRTVVAYRFDEAGRHLRDDRLHDPWAKWKQARLDAWKSAKPFYALLVLGYLVLMGFAVRNASPWVAAAASITFIAIGVELTCYYYAFILAVALLYAEDERAGVTLLALTSFTGIVDWRPTPSLPGWLDEQYTLMSAATVLAFGIMLWDMGLGRWLAERAARAAEVAGAAAKPLEPASQPASPAADAASSTEPARPVNQSPVNETPVKHKPGKKKRR